MKHVICNNCGWVHFEVSVEYVLKWQDEWIDHWLSLNDESRKNYGVLDRPPSYKRDEYWWIPKSDYLAGYNGLSNDIVHTIMPMLEDIMMLGLRTNGELERLNEE